LLFFCVLFGRFWRKAKVGKGIQIIVNLLERIHDLSLELLILIIANAKEVLKLRLIQLPQAKFTLIPANLLQRAKMFPNQAGINKPLPIVKHIP
jgi:hypothetical protein